MSEDCCRTNGQRILCEISRHDHRCLEGGDIDRRVTADAVMVVRKSVADRVLDEPRARARRRRAGGNPALMA